MSDSSLVVAQTTPLTMVSSSGKTTPEVAEHALNTRASLYGKDDERFTDYKTKLETAGYTVTEVSNNKYKVAKKEVAPVITTPTPPSSAPQQEKLSTVTLTNESIVAQNNINITRTPITSAETSQENPVTSQSSAYLYQQWDLKQEGKTLILKKRDGTEVRIEKKSEEEAKYVKELLRPTGVDSYEAKQGDNGNEVTLSQIQHAFLTGERIDKIAEKIKYNSQTKEVAISLVDNKTLESKDYIFNQAQIERGRTDRYNNTIASSTTHQDINTFLDLALRQHSGGNDEELKNNDVLDPKNLYGRFGQLQFALDPTKEQTDYSSNAEGKLVKGRASEKRLSLEQLAEMQKTAPEAGITLWIKQRKIAPGVNDPEQEKIVKNSGLVLHHAYTLVSVDLKTRTAWVVNPHDSSKLLKITDATQFFNRAYVENG